MNGKMIAGGVVGALVALGFVCPQLQTLQVNGSLELGGILLLMMGLAGTLAGLWCVFKGVNRPSTPAS